MEHLLTATNTFNNDDDRNTNIYTCNYHGRHEPQQIDHILSSDHSLRSITFDSSATASDHWGLTATIRERYGKTLERRHVRKPIGWVCNDHIAFNNTVRTQLNGGSGFFGQELRLSDNRSFVLYIYTDGSAKDEPRIQKCAGWRFTAMTKRPRLGDKPMIKACGPVQISKCEEFYIGAKRVIEALFWLNTCVERKGADR